MLKLIPIKVECYAGYKAYEYPKFLFIGNDKIRIEEIKDRWYQGENNPDFPESNYFKVLTVGGDLYIIKHDLENDMWYLCQ